MSTFSQEEFTKAFRAETKDARTRPEYRYWGWQVAGRYRGVYLNLDVCSGRVELVEIQTPRRLAGKGAASRALDWLAATAKAFGKTVNVRVEPFGHCPMTKDQLTTWYARHGLQG